MKRAIGILLAITLLLALTTGCGIRKTGNSITEVKVTLPCATGSRAIVEGEAVIATQAYLLARAYFEKLETYDMDSFDPQQYSDLLAETAEAFRIAEALCSSFESHAGAFAEAEENGAVQQEKATYEVLSAPDENLRHFSFIPVAYAAEEKSPAIRYAEELTKTFDEAKNGQKLKAVAEKYGTDVKKAKVMLEQAQAILEGGAYTDLADFENKCYEAAVETKAAASMIGFGVAVAATGGIAAGGASAAGIIEAGGVAFSGVSAVIDMGTAVTIHTTNGEGNEYTAAWEKTGEMVAPVADVFSIGGGIQNIKDFRNPEKALQAVDNAAQACLVGLGLTRDYVQDGTVLGVSSNIINGYREIIIRATDTSDPEAAKKVLEQTGINEDTSEQAEKSGIGEAAPSVEQPQSGSLGAQADVYINAMEELIDPENPFDTGTFTENIDNAFRECAASEGIKVEDVGEPSETEQTEEVTAPQQMPGSEVAGNYEMTLAPADGMTDIVSAEVTLQPDGTMEISFGTHKVWFDDNFQEHMDTSVYASQEHLVGHYDAATHTFSGRGDVIGESVTSDGFTFDTTTFWNQYDTVLTFCPEDGTASGVLAKDESILGMSIETQITMIRKDGDAVPGGGKKLAGSVLSADKVVGIYRFENQEGTVLEYLFAVNDTGMTIVELGQIDAYEGIYDEKTGVFTRDQDGLGMKATFTEKNGKITATLIFYQGEVISAEYTGEKM